MGCCCPHVYQRGVIFGSPCAFGDEPEVSSTSSTTTFATHQSLVTPVLPAGDDWFLGIDCYVSTENPDNTKGKIEMQVLFDAAIIASSDFIFTGSGIAQGSERVLYTKCAVLTGVTAGAHTISLNYRVDPGSFDPGDEVSIAWSSIEFWRFRSP